MFPFACRFRQYIIEDFETTRFKDLTAYKNYFGEKRSLWNAFFNFFFSWFFIPAIIALPLIFY